MKKEKSEEGGKALTAPGFNDPVFVDQIRRDMLKFATLQIGDESLAEDAVQEAMIAAHQNIDSFGRKSAFKTWVFAILKNKIIDILRKGSREVSVSPLEDEEFNGLSSALFDHRGHWNKVERPADWCAPMEAVKNEQFWLVFDACLNRLPETLGRVFMMREFIELESDEICTALDISSGNLYVMLYRSRMRLRECLENNWFGEAV